MGNNSGKSGRPGPGVETEAERRRRKDRREESRRLDDSRMAGIGEVMEDRRRGPRRAKKAREERQAQAAVVEETPEQAEARNRRQRQDRRSDSRRLDDLRMAGIGEVMDDRRYGPRRREERRG